jgi:hypothetical protein
VAGSILKTVASTLLPCVERTRSAVTQTEPAPRAIRSGVSGSGIRVTGLFVVGSIRQSAGCVSRVGRHSPQSQPPPPPPTGPNEPTPPLADETPAHTTSPSHDPLSSSADSHRPRPANGDQISWTRSREVTSIASYSANTESACSTCRPITSGERRLVGKHRNTFVCAICAVFK